MPVNLNRNREDGIAAIAGLETRIAGLQKQLDTAILEARSVSPQLEEERESSRQSALELQKLRDQLAQKSEAAQKAEATRLRLEAVEAELEKERGSAATLIQLRSEIAVERAASKKSEAHAAELEENLSRNREDGIAAITGLETRVEGLQEKLDAALLEARSVSLRLEEERESSQRSALEQQKLRDQLAEKSEAAQRAEARSAELETCLEQSVRDASSKVTALESQISDLRGQLDQSIQSRQSVEQQDQNLSVALGSLESSALEVLRQLATRHNAPVGGEMNQRR
jgi:chromosome segregation ATPase